MRTLATFTAAAALLAVMGFSGTAWADPTVNLLDNEGAEAGTGNVPDDWTLNGAAAGRFNGNINFTDAPRTGSWFFTTALAAVGDDGFASLDQDVDISGCSVTGIDGLWSASGWIETFPNGDFGDLDITFFDITPTLVGSAAVNNLMSTGYSQFSTSGTIPAGAVTANYEITGTEGPGAATGIFADVTYDDLDFNITCVKDFAKISGVKNVHGGKGGGSTDRGPQWAFSGIVGTFDDPSMTTTGTIVINYRQLGPTSCEFTPSAAISYDGSGGATVTATYLCTGGTKDTDTGNATIDLTSKGETACPGKDRGSVRVIADDGDLDITGSEGNTGNENCVARGNVIVDDVV